jgi:hypothetical protein
MNAFFDFIVVHYSHVHWFKYVNIRLTSDNLRYTRIGLGDPNNDSFVFQLCSGSSRPDTFHIETKTNGQPAPNGCYDRRIPLDEIDHDTYSFDEPLLSDQSRSDQVLMSETNNLMPDFVEHFFGSRRLILDN